MNKNYILYGLLFIAIVAVIGLSIALQKKKECFDIHKMCEKDGDDCTVVEMIYYKDSDQKSAYYPGTCFSGKCYKK